MKKTFILFSILMASGLAFADGKEEIIIRFMNVGDPSPYYFCLARDKSAPEKTSVTNPVRKLKTEAVSDPYTVPAGSYYICGSYDLKNWGYNNEPIRLLPGTDYFILRVKPGEGYKVISYYKSGKDLGFDLLQKELNTPEKISSWMQANLSYVSKYGRETGDQDAKKTFDLGTGNCFDMAVFSYFLLERNGYKPRLMVIQLSNNDPKNHIVTVFEKSDAFFTIDNTELHGPFADYAAIAIAHDAKWWRYGIFNDVKKAAGFSDPIVSDYRK